MKHLNIKHFPSNKHFYLTKEGLDELKAKLDNLRRERTMICKDLMNMDQKEKNEHILSLDAIKIIEMNEKEVVEIDEILHHSSVVDGQISKMTHDNVKIGSTVFIKDGHKKYKYKLVDSIEANPMQNKISDESPLGRALIGKHMHDIVSFIAPKGKKFTYEVDSIL